MLREQGWQKLMGPIEDGGHSVSSPRKTRVAFSPFSTRILEQSQLRILVWLLPPCSLVVQDVPVGASLTRIAR